MFADFVHEYKDGVIASVQGFLVLHKLDQTSSQSSSVLANPQRASSAEPISRMTILEKRRLQQKTDKKINVSQPSVIRSKIPAYYRVAQCVGVNVASIVFVQVLVWGTEWLFPDRYPILNALFSSLRLALIVPVYAVIRILSTLWFADVANAAYRFKGSTQTPQSTVTILFSKTASDFLHALLVELVFALQTVVIQSLPIPVGNHVLGFVFMSSLNSLYCFEYVWMNAGILMNRRILLVERRWPFHMGFGSILTFLTTYSDHFIVNSFVFGALFPFFIKYPQYISFTFLSLSQTNSRWLCPVGLGLFLVFPHRRDSGSFKLCLKCLTIELS